MNLQQFCIKNNFPLTKTARVLRKVVQNHAARESQKTTEFRKIGVDWLFEEAGLHVRKPEGHGRIQYTVLNSEKLVAFLALQLHYDALSEADIRVLVNAASFLSKTIRGKNEWRLVQKHSGMPYLPDMALFENLCAALLKAGSQE